MIVIDKTSKVSLYYQIYDQIKEGIKSGHMQSGSKLCPIRVLCDELGVGKNTVNNAYKQLVAEGYVNNVQGCGFVVEDMHKYIINNSVNKNTQSDKTISKNAEILYDFNFSSLNEETFSFSTFKNCLNKVMLDYDFKEFFEYGEYQGLNGLREQIKLYLYQHRGISCETKQIVLCTGIQDVLCKLCTFLPEKYLNVGVEVPSHYSIPKIFAHRHVPITNIPAEYNENYCDFIKNSDAKLILTTPSHQFPLGFSMGIKQRYQLLQCCQENDLLVFEDDYDNELRYDSKPIPALFSIDDCDRVIYFGTFSKIFAPGLRLSYMILPPFLVEPFTEIYESYHPNVSFLVQKTIEIYYKEGHMEKLVRKNHYYYKNLHKVLINTIKESFKSSVKILSKGAGLHILLEIPNAPSTDWLEQKAREVGVKIYPIDNYYHGEKHRIPPNTFLLGYASMDEKKIIKGIQLLKKAWQEIL